jgi:hypothetical protein
MRCRASYREFFQQRRSEKPARYSGHGSPINLGFRRVAQRTHFGTLVGGGVPALRKGKNPRRFVADAGQEGC